MDFESLKTYCLSLPGVEETYPFGPEACWFKIGGKAFAWTFVQSFNMDGVERPPFIFINMKCDPEGALSLRESHAAIQGGWHQNKKYWNSVFMDGSLADDLVEDLVRHAYEVVLGSLSKKAQREIQDGQEG